MRDKSYKRVGDRIVTVPVSPELHHRLQIHAVTEGRTIKWIVTRLIEQHLASVDWLKANGAVTDQQSPNPGEQP